MYGYSTICINKTTYEYLIEDVAGKDTKKFFKSFYKTHGNEEFVDAYLIYLPNKSLTFNDVMFMIDIYDGKYTAVFREDINTSSEYQLVLIDNARENDEENEKFSLDDMIEMIYPELRNKFKKIMEEYKDVVKDKPCHYSSDDDNNEEYLAKVLKKRKERLQRYEEKGYVCSDSE